MPSLLTRYARWLHTGWPAGPAERLPDVREDGTTRVPGLFVTGDLLGVPLLKFALDSGARIVGRIAADPGTRARNGDASDALDLAIVGAGVSGMAAALAAQRLGLSFRVIEGAVPFATLIDFPVRKPIFTYPSDFTPAGPLQVSATVKEDLVAELEAQVRAAGIAVTPGRAERIERDAGALVVRIADAAPMRARRVLIAVGRTGAHRSLAVPGGDREHVHHRLHDPNDFAHRAAVVVGGGDSACEAAAALAEAGARVTLVHRDGALVRPKRENVERVERLAAATAGEARDGSLALRLGWRVREVGARAVTIESGDGAHADVPADVVFAMLGRAAPLEFLRRSGVRIRGDWTRARVLGMTAFVAFCAWLYDWKSGGAFTALWQRHDWFPFNLPALLAAAGGSLARDAADPRTLAGTLAISAASPSFLYTLAYSAVIVTFGIRRIRRRRLPYVTVQTLVLMGIQVGPLFLLPEIVLPLLHHNGLLPRGLADALFPVVTYGHGREFWRAYGLVLAWPLNVYNVFTDHPLPWWLAISAVQTLVLIPLGVWWFGKGAYCGWICSCGALAETLGDDQRHKMPHGPRWNRLNMAGQALLAIAFVLLGVRIAGWALPPGNTVALFFVRVLQPSWKWGVDVFLAGVLGYGLYFALSGRVWCRFFCPLAAFMHVLARFSRFAIVPDKPKCISCNVCTSICHQGIDVMRFANQGLPMRDPECVRCSACVDACPTGVLQFGQVRGDGTLISVDQLLASPVHQRERS